MLNRLKSIIRKITRKEGQSPDALTDVFRVKYERFKELLDSNSELSRIIAEIEEKLQGYRVFGMSYVRSQSARAIFHTLRMIGSFDALSNRKYPGLLPVFESLTSGIKKDLDSRKEAGGAELVLPYSRVTTDVIESVGGKNANLGEMKNRVHLPVPDGFAVTTRAFELFLTENDLIEEIAMKKMALDPEDTESLNAVSEEIQRLIISAPVPAALGEAVLAAYDEMAKTGPGAEPAAAPPRISMRSSALGEDSALSFAGQYLSVLNVPREQILKTYTFVIASLFTPRAMSYRLMKGIPDDQAAMSVACIRMVDSVASGVMYSRHPLEPQNDGVIISAVWGLGPYAVDGVITPDKYTVSRAPDRDILQKDISKKPVKLVSNPEGGLLEREVEEGEQEFACLSDRQIKALAAYALRLEEHYGTAQDIEWALDRQGNIFLLQTRPLGAGPEHRALVVPTPDPQKYPLLLEGGQAAFPGVGSGKAFHFRSEEDLQNFPEGAVLIAPQPSPKFMVIMPRASAIVTDFGSITGHMASLSREFSIPTLLDTGTATSAVPEGAEITVDAFSGKIYLGAVPELTALQTPREPRMKGTPVYETLSRLAAHITPLRLIDPKSADFTPENCRSLHDLMRFIHELSYTEMFRISDLVSEHAGFAAKLIAPIPLDLHVIDLGGGISEANRSARSVRHDCIVSVPFKALLGGMLHEDLLHHRPRPIDMRGFFSVMGEQMFQDHLGSERFGNRSFAIISDKYLNFSSRVGYHYGVLDTYCGKTLSKNYITFSFKGGAADDVRRNRRARAIARILESTGMSVDVLGDRVSARVERLDAALLTEKLDTIGRLLQFTRQLDMLMKNEESVAAIAKAFLEENYHLQA
ncbi:MAG: PEP/pyruvate-binding domain-containing protein [Syntrophobacteraceae bacterium]